MISPNLLVRKLKEVSVSGADIEPDYECGVLFNGPDLRRLFIAGRDARPRVKTEMMVSEEGVEVSKEIEERLSRMVRASNLQKKKDYRHPPALALVA